MVKTKQCGGWVTVVISPESGVLFTSAFFPAHIMLIATWEHDIGFFPHFKHLQAPMILPAPHPHSWKSETGIRWDMWTHFSCICCFWEGVIPWSFQIHLRLQ